MKRHFSSKQKMLEEKGLHCGKDSTGSSLFLEYTVFQFLVEEESLFPRVVKMTLSVLEKQIIDGDALLP